MAIVETFTTGKALFDLLRIAIDARDDAKIKEALSELQAKYFELGSSAIGLLEKSFGLMEVISTLNEQLTVIKSTNSELERQVNERDLYRLKEVSAGKFAYFAEANDKFSEPAHYLCQPCKDGAIKSVLRLTKRGQSNVYVCPENGRHGFSV